MPLGSSVLHVTCVTVLPTSKLGMVDYVGSVDGVISRLDDNLRRDHCNFCMGVLRRLLGRRDVGHGLLAVVHHVGVWFVSGAAMVDWDSRVQFECFLATVHIGLVVRYMCVLSVLAVKI